jgi:hypothetical protein
MEALVGLPPLDLVVQGEARIVSGAWGVGPTFIPIAVTVE